MIPPIRWDTLPIATSRPTPYHRTDGEDRRRGGRVQALNDWFHEQTSTPAGSILFFLLFFLVRVGIDEAARRREKRRKHHKRVEA